MQKKFTICSFIITKIVIKRKGFFSSKSLAILISQRNCQRGGEANLNHTKKKNNDNKENRDILGLFTISSAHIGENVTGKTTVNIELRQITSYDGAKS